MGVYGSDPRFRDHHRVDARGSKGVQYGNGNRQQNNFFHNHTVISLGSAALAPVLITGLILCAGPIGGVFDSVRSFISGSGLAQPAGEGPSVGFAASPEATLKPSSGAKTAPITVSGSGFSPGEKVAVRVHTYEAATVKADDSGAMSVKFRIPSDTFCPQDQCHVTVQGKSSIKWTEAVYSVR